MSYGTAQTKSVSKQGACAECAITTHLATLKVCILGCFIHNATPPDMTATALQEVAQGTHKNLFFYRPANVPELQQHEIQLPYHEPSLVGKIGDRHPDALGITSDRS